ncbi:Protein phosphatase 2C 7 [Raphanus sativus]|uniref:protein-serine/threonine phosphatase n=1 Tax=Raphanus sativus TaxID=3726 RepID=A0A6J0KUW0_RAPSA|nr:protein phosphatase 2C 7 [Raphanus sativus]XP_056847577.1 protein phosphatase 2C 7 [Raphanus sativus]XP_056857242.1 protein phosphatase 2C 7-like [Raphanus sativus]KAJ4866751.1 Protein phosphatase 2C 7 [Raphanus sativus]KAJ4879420.1 Protein phosphatase 2C 7 [Raphanus sativus]
MEEISPAVALTLSLANTMCDSGISSSLDITELENVTDAVDMLSDQKVQSFSNGEVEYMMEEDVLVVSDATIISEGLIVVDARSEISLPDNGRVLATAIILNETTIDQVPTAEVLITSLNHDVNMEEVVAASSSEVVVIRFPEENHNVARGGGSRSVYELDCIPLWGTVSICGDRSEMEDAVRALPRFLKIPIKMLMGGDHEGMSPSLTHLTSHFFGVYDGHGGLQVADYCHDRIHFALAEEIEWIKEELLCERNNTGEGRQVLWEKVFFDCFLKVDDEVKGKINRPVVGSPDEMVLEAVSPETVGSTAVVALVCSSHIIVSNCGDSRAVLLRGKESMPLSVDHKPDREDEYARIERAGGKVIQWQGARVSGVLAMSRSIGDQYLEPYVIPDPEVTFMPRAREDECLILASDGLWDVMSNQEACEFARRRILLWHKRNGALPLAERGVGEDQACQAAADYLSKLALQKGSRDNISIIVVDLKAQRKLKTRS